MPALKTVHVPSVSRNRGSSPVSVVELPGANNFSEVKPSAPSACVLTSFTSARYSRVKPSNAAYFNEQIVVKRTFECNGVC